MRGDDDKDTRQTEDEYKEDQGNCWSWRIGEGRLETKSD